jgi:hypothetical protein
VHALVRAVKPKAAPKPAAEPSDGKSKKKRKVKVETDGEETVEAPKAEKRKGKKSKK